RVPPPAHGLRAERADVILSQTISSRETIMWFRNYLKSLTATTTQRPTRRPKRASRPCVELLEGRWVPSFSQPVDVGADPPATPGWQSVVAADFNGDGRLDLATANRQLNTISVVLGNGDGTFQPARTST